MHVRNCWVAKYGRKRGVPEKSRWASLRRDVDVGRVSGNILRMRNDPEHCGSFGSVITRTKIALPHTTQHTGELHLDVPATSNPGVAKYLDS
jgi:hypothetical protein